MTVKSSISLTDEQQRAALKALLDQRSAGRLSAAPRWTNPSRG